MANSGVQMLAGGAFAICLTPLSGGLTHAPPGAGALLAAACLSLVASLLTYSAFVYLSRTWPLARMSTYIHLNPVGAVFPSGPPV